MACLPQVWHNGTKPRYVLYVSVWHPDMWQNASARAAASVEALMGRSVAEHKRLCASIMKGSFKVPSRGFEKGRKGRNKKDTDVVAESATHSSPREHDTPTDALQLRSAAEKQVLELEGMWLKQHQCCNYPY